MSLINSISFFSKSWLLQSLPINPFAPEFPLNTQWFLPPSITKMRKTHFTRTLDCSFSPTKWLQLKGVWKFHWSWWIWQNFRSLSLNKLNNEIAFTTKGGITCPWFWCWILTCVEIKPENLALTSAFDNTRGKRAQVPRKSMQSLCWICGSKNDFFFSLWKWKRKKNSKRTCVWKMKIVVEAHPMHLINYGLVY